MVESFLPETITARVVMRDGLRHIVNPDGRLIGPVTWRLEAEPGVSFLQASIGGRLYYARGDESELMHFIRTDIPATIRA